MSRPATRLLTLLELLQERPGIGGRDIAAALDVDERTVRRYLHRLDELGIPVEATRGREGGYRLRPGHRLPPLMFSDDEAVAVVNALAGAPRSDAGSSALAKLRGVLPLGVQLRSAPEHVELGEEVVVWMDCTPEELRVPGEAIPAPRGGVYLRTRTDDPEAFARQLALQGCRMVIEQPAELRDAVARLGAILTSSALRAP